jgi:hypothetical protein
MSNSLNSLFVKGLSLCCALAAPIVFSQAASAQTKPKATQQLNKANQGETQRGQVYDGRRAPAVVRANPAPKASPVGQQIRSTANSPGYQPAAPRMRTTAPPSPTGTSYNKKK